MKNIYSTDIYDFYRDNITVLKGLEISIRSDTDVCDIAWIEGYKFTQRAIIYGGPFYQWGQLDGYRTITDAATEALNSNRYMLGANIAIEHRFSFGMGLGGEIVYSNLD